MAQVEFARIPEALRFAFMDGDERWEGRLQEQANLTSLVEILGLIHPEGLQRLQDQVSPEVSFELVAPSEFPWVRQARGPLELADALAVNFGSIRDQEVEILALVAQGDHLMLMARETGLWVATGERYDVLTAQQYTFDAGRLLRFRSVVGLVH